MSTDLLEAIKTWRSIYVSISAPDTLQNANDIKYHDRWYSGMMKVIGSMYVIDELKNTPVEKHLIKAVEDGKSKDISKLDDIYVLLGEVEKYLMEKVLS